MISKLTVVNFKCFGKLEIDIKPLTLLCGVNSGGKSSAIQALLLCKETMNRENSQGTLDLMNSQYNTNLYSFEEILYQDAEEEKIQIEVEGKDFIRKYTYESEDGDNNISYKCEFSQGSEKGKIWYLGSDRQISQYQKRGNAELLELGIENEYMAFILDRGRSGKISVDKARNLEDMDNALLSTQVNEWLNYILPGSQVYAAPMGNDNLLSLYFGAEYKRHKTNVGYGVSFVLPILVSGLLAKAGDILVIENPELHLHPKAQSDLMFFLTRIASTGVQVVVETHSDHAINGVRKSIVNPDCTLRADETAIYFFESNNDLHCIQIDAGAQLSDWPDDFMEQEEKDLQYIRMMRKAHDN